MIRSARLPCWLLITSAALCACASQPRTAGRDLPAAARGDPQRMLVIGVSDAPMVAPARAGSTFRGYLDDSSYAVGDEARRTLRDVAQDYALRKVAEWPIHLLQMQCAVYEMPAGSSRAELLASLGRDARIRLAQPLQSFSTETRGGAGGEPGAAAPDGMDLQAAHQLAQGEGVRIAVIDTGVDAGHPDLAGRVEAEYDFVETRRGASHQERHGTAVAGVIAARTSNAHGVLGIAPRSRLLVLKACWQLEPGRDDARCNSYTLAQALAKAVELRAQVINLSLTGPPDPLLSALLERATRQGIIVVGPGGGEETAGSFPGAERSVLGVVSAEAGPAPERMLRAPGSDVLTLAPGHATFLLPGTPSRPPRSAASPRCCSRPAACCAATRCRPCCATPASP